MPTYTLPNTDPPVTITLPENLDLPTLLQYTPFTTWLAALKADLQEKGRTADRWTLHALTARDPTFSAPNHLATVTITATLRRTSTQPTELTRTVHLRSGIAALLIVLRPKDGRTERRDILIAQLPRDRAAGDDSWKIPTVVLDEDAGPQVPGEVVEAVRQQIGWLVRRDELVDLSALAPPGAAQGLPVLLWERRLDRREFEQLKKKLTQGWAAKGVKLKVCDHNHLATEAAGDDNALAADKLYDVLSNDGVIWKEVESVLRF